MDKHNMLLVQCPIMKRQIGAVCTKCGHKFKTFNKGAMGMWMGTCTICGMETHVADGGHDFGIYELDEKTCKEEEVERTEGSYPQSLRRVLGD